jgi:urease accessory protein
MPAATDGATYALGFVIATALFHAIGLAAAFGGHLLTSRLGNGAARLAGGALALGGVGVLGGWL